MHVRTVAGPDSISSVLTNSTNQGYAHHKIIYDKDLNPINYRVLKIDAGYTRILNITQKQAVGKIATDLYRVPEPPYLDVYARVAQTQKPEIIEVFFPPLQCWFFIVVTSQKKGTFDTTFVDITERKKLEIINKALVEQAADSILLLNKEGRVIESNPASWMMFGYEQSDIIGKSPSLFSPEFQPDGRRSAIVAQENDLATLAGKAPVFEWRHCRRDGTLFDAEVHLCRIDLPGGPYIQAIVRDITVRKEVERKWKQQMLYLEAISEMTQIMNTTADIQEVAGMLHERLNCTGAMIVIDGPNNNLVMGGISTKMGEETNAIFSEIIMSETQNPGLYHYFRNTKKPTLINMKDFVGQLLAEEQVSQTLRPIEPSLTEIQDSRVLYHVPMMDADGSWYAHLAIFRLMQDGFDAEDRILIETLAKALTLALKNKFHKEKLERKVMTDANTGLHNEQKFLEDIELYKKQHVEPGYVLRLKMKEFSLVNSRLGGQHVGDDYIRKMAAALVEMVQHDFPGSIVSKPTRAGFDVLLNASTEEAALLFAESVRVLFEELTLIGEMLVQTEVHIGLCQTTDAAIPEELMQYADLALAAATQQNSGTVIAFYDKEMKIKQDNKIKLVLGISAGLEHDEFFPVFHPYVDFDGDIHGYEVLARWRTADGILHQPGEFIESMQSMKKLQRLFEVISTKACYYIPQFTQSKIYFSINISPVQFAYNQLLQKTLNIFIEAGVSPLQIKFEILEDDYTFNKYISVMKAFIHPSGFSFALDDYGQRNSTPEFLRGMVEEGIIDTVKIDRQAIKNINRGYETVTRTIGMAHDWHLHVIAEGVETKVQVKKLKQICDDIGMKDLLMQGFLFSEPRPFEEFGFLPKNAYAHVFSEKKE
jgi:PAS domain S-box-containing protein